MIDVEQTAVHIEAMAQELKHYSRHLEMLAKLTRKRNDLDYAAEAAQSIANLIGNVRLDLLVMRPIRAMRNEIKKSDD